MMNDFWRRALKIIVSNHVVNLVRLLGQVWALTSLERVHLKMIYWVSTSRITSNDAVSSS